MTHIPAQTSILIVDDDSGLRRTMAMIFERIGYAVETAADGAEAVERVRDRPFDMILMDVRMPVLDGVHALKQIKAIRPEAVVTMMTGFALEDLLQDALTEGAFALLDKPVSIDEVIVLIKQAQEIRQGGLILIADDDPAAQTTLYSILTQHGYRVCLARSREEAIAQVRDHEFDVVLVDLRLPAFNGLEVYMELKAICPQAVAIVFTVFPRGIHDLSELASNGDAYTCLSKPLDIDSLLELVQKVVTKKQG
ncbi:MAG: response regulator [Anaerolineae bacterium]|nr:response regulator [Anaerolineae bacterium]